MSMKQEQIDTIRKKILELMCEQERTRKRQYAEMRTKLAEEMRTNLTIKNFRVFDEDGDTFELAPITVLTGCNSSGKSSVVKALMMLNEFLKQFKDSLAKGDEPKWRDYKVDFRKQPFNLLGRFDKIVNKQSDNDRITLEYSVYSNKISKEVGVIFNFAANDKDELNNAYLAKLTIATDDGIVLSFGDEGGLLNLNIIKEVCLDALYAQFSENFDNESVLNCKVIEWSKQNNSLFRIPIVEQISHIPKEKLLEHVGNEYKVSDNHLSLAIHKIINDFIESEHSLFADYYKQHEHEYLNNSFDATMGHPFDLDLKIPQDFWGSFIDRNPEVAQVDCSTEMLKKPLVFPMIYEVLMEWNQVLCSADEVFYAKVENKFSQNYYQHRILTLLSDYVSDLIKETLCPEWSGNLDYSSSSRVVVQRIYSLDDRDGQFSELLKRKFENKRKYLSEGGAILGRRNLLFPVYKIDSFTNKWISVFGIGESISMELNSEGVGLKIWVNKTNGEKNLLADEGYGITQLVSILLQVENAIIENKIKKPKTESHCITVAIEEPEIHLHPAYQSKLAEMFADAYLEHGIRFIIETHSEYLIRKLQVMVADKACIFQPDDISLNYVDRGEDGVARNKKIGIAEDGSLIDEFGEGFYDEADNLAMELFRKKPILS